MKRESNRSTFHVFIIPDGNRRWTKKQSLPALEGHAAGYERFKEVIKKIWDFGVTHLTIWALSKDNLKRNRLELLHIHKLLRRAIYELRDSPDFKNRDIRFRAVGDWERALPKALASEIRKLEEDTKMRRGRTLTLAIAYDGNDEMSFAVGAIREHEKDAPITDALVRRYLPSGFLPDIDLMIRTGGEPHLSAGAFMWQMRDAQLYFLDTFWPEFSIDDLSGIIANFKERDRRFGK